MKTKDQNNQNPEIATVQEQEENSKSEKKSDKKVKEKKTKSSVSRTLKAKKPAKEVRPSETEKQADEPEKKPSRKPRSTKKKTEESVDATVIADDNAASQTKPERKKRVRKEPLPVSDKEDEPSKKPAVKSNSKKPVQVQLSEDELTIEDTTEDEEEDTEETETANEYGNLSREELVQVLEETIKEGDFNAIKVKVALIKVAFLKLNKEVQHKKYEEFIAEGGEESEFETAADPLEQQFNNAFAVYKQKRQVYLDEQENQKQKNLESKMIILEELKALIDSEETLKKTYDEFKTLQDRWKEIGMVPKKEVNNLWQSYHFYVERFFDKVKINKELRDLDLKKNLELKISLCEKAEELLLESSILKSFKALQLLHQQWKEVGPVPQDKKDEIWERFKTTSDKLNSLRHEHYGQLQDDQKNNFIAKTAICEKAEEIIERENTNIKDWQENTDQITELLKVWKTIGPAPRKQNDEVWDRFKTSLDAFFAAKKDYFQKIKDEQLNNYNIKLDLCAQAEAIKSSTDWKSTTQELIRLQKDWKNIGPVPRKQSEKIWKRFRAACDEFFTSKSEFFNNIGKHEQDNLKLKEDLIKKVEEFEFDTNKNHNLDALKTFQRDWTDIGHVPIKEKERLQAQFRNAINKQLDKLNISRAEIQTLNYKVRVEDMKDRPNAGKMISHERNLLMSKRKKMEEEVKLWENNIGFLANSKKASLLKEEFEKKINDGKKEIEVLTTKIKLLDKEYD